MEDSNTILTDKRPIAALYGTDDSVWRAGRGITIEAYGEPGEYCYKPWFRILKEGVVTHRAPAHLFTVEYSPQTTAPTDEGNHG